MDEFQQLRETVNEDTGERETFLQKAIQQHGRGQILHTIAEIQERHDAIRDIEKNLKELHQIFLDIDALVQHQGEQLDINEAHRNKPTAGGQKTSKKHPKMDLLFNNSASNHHVGYCPLSIRPWAK
ncbi:hypothetical protein RDABS01_004043 [Bienertia sinuspersici]